MDKHLYYTQLGDDELPNLLIMHGLYGSSDNWHSVARALQDNYCVTLVDLRNHGRSPHYDSMLYSEMADDVVELLKNIGVSSATVMGHSMGGKVAMNLALRYEYLVEKLVVVDIAPKTYDGLHNFGEVTNNHRAIIDALLKIQLDKYHTRASIDAELAKELKSTTLRAFLLKNLERCKEDKNIFQWRLNLKVISDSLSQIMQGFDKDDFDSFPSSKEVFLIKGEDSNYVHQEDEKHMRDLFPSLQVAIISNAGHWLHSEQPEQFLNTLKYFLNH